MQRWTVVFLVLLRLSIGWHFLFEGLNKVQSHLVGPTVTNRPFSSAGYFREAPGPLGWAFRATNGDPDAEALARLETLPRDESADPAGDKPHLRLPPGLRRDWRALVKRFSRHYGFDEAEAQAVYEQQASMAVGWLEYEPDPIFHDVLARFGKVESVDTSLLNEKEGAAYSAFLANTTDQTVTFATGDVKRRMTMPERIADYRAKLADLQDRTSRKLWRFGRNVEGPRLAAAKAELTRLRAGLLDDLDREQTAALVQALNVKALGAAVEALASRSGEVKAALLGLSRTPIDLKVFAAQLKVVEAESRRQGEASKADAAKAKEYEGVADALGDAIKGLPSVEALPPLPPDNALAWADWLTMWGLTVIGACLLAGFLTRLNCWLAALFLLMTYLAVPSLPWLPAAGPQEGNYVFVNKNVVEMFALCVLGTLPTGRWFGADGLLRSTWRWTTGASVEDEYAAK